MCVSSVKRQFHKVNIPCGTTEYVVTFDPNKSKTSKRKGDQSTAPKVPPRISQSIYLYVPYLGPSLLVLPVTLVTILPSFQSPITRLYRERQ